MLYTREATSGDLVFTFTILLAILILSGLLVFSIIRERKRRKMEKEDNKVDSFGLLSKKAVEQTLNEFIRTYHLSKEASVFIFELSNTSELVDSFGKKREIKLREALIHNIVQLLPKNTVFAEYKPESDSYIVLLRGVIARDKLLGFADSLVDVIERPLEVQGMNIETSYSCYLGIAFYPQHAITATDLINKAELALYMNHKMDNYKYSVYSTQFDETEKENVAYYTEIRSAIKNKEFVLYYQPIIDYKERKIIGYEALIRWNHPTLGVLSPNKFLSVLENSGDIIWVGKWSMNSICSFYGDKLETFLHDDIFISINLSVKQLLNTNIVREFNDILKKYNIPTSAICIEIEEFTLYEKYQSLGETISAFSKAGYKIAIDHFGLDSNNIMKIEKQQGLYMVKVASNDIMLGKDSFVGQKMNTILFDTCQKHDVKICALMVESIEEMNYMSDNSVALYQGYYISSPLPKEELLSFSLEDALNNKKQEESEKK